MYKNFFKPIVDFVVSFVGCLFLIPVYLLVTILLAVANKGNPFFIQVRPGKDEELFKIIKFKTMSDEKDEKGNLLPDEQRLTPVGKIIRKTSIDETPQLINVLKGDMSLIGPRPLLPEYLPRYNDHQKKRHLVRPGITGLAAVNGRNNLSWNDKMDYDVYYVENLSFKLDLEILKKTFFKVIKSEGVNKPGKATTEEFNGTN